MIDPSPPPEAPESPGPRSLGAAPHLDTGSLVVELSREDKAPAFERAPTTTYRRHWGNGRTHNADFKWSAAIQADFAAVQGDSPDKEAGTRLGDTLRELMGRLSFPEVEHAVEQRWNEGARADIVLRFGAHELLALPWELMPTFRDDGAPLGQRDRCIVQYEVPDTATRLPDAPPAEGGAIVFGWNGDVPAAAHAEAIEAARAASGIATATLLPDLSLDELRATLELEKPAVLHLLCHGAPLGSGRAYGLVLRSDGGAGTTVVASSDLRAVLEPHAASLRLVVLCACWGGSAGALDSALGSVAEELHAAGIQAVIASRFPLSKAASTVFTKALYTALLADVVSLQDAFLAARKAVLRAGPTSYDWASLQLYARSADGPDLRPFVFRPYRGLLSFDSAHARFFFGRRNEVREAITEIASLLSAEPPAPRLFVVTGASGRGKSSFVAAGVVPRLAEGLPAGDRAFHTRTIRPSDGLAALDAALAGAEPDKLFVLVVDQLEEVFTAAGEAGPRQYIEKLWATATDPGKRVLVLGSLRVDFITRFGDFRLDGDTTLEHLLYRPAHHVSLGPLRREDLVEVIEAPARLVGLTLQDGLARAIVEDAYDEPGTLPLVQYVLDELWKGRAGRELSLDQYAARGGVRGALQKRAEDTLAALTKKDPAQGALVERLLVRLVATQDDAERATRRIVKRSELAAELWRDASLFETVLDELVDARLVVVRTGEGKSAAEAGESFVEVAHEALIRSWEKLREWVTAHHAIRSKLDAYEKMARGKDNFLGAEALATLRTTVKEHEEYVSPAIQALLLRSELVESARLAAEKLHLTRARDHRRRVIAVAVIASLWAVATTVLGVVIWRKSDAVADAQIDLQNASDKALASAQQARRESILSEARAMVARGEPVWAAKLLLEIDAPEKVAAWVDVANEVLEKRLPYRTVRGALAAARPDGQWIATADMSRPAVLVERTDGTGKLRRLDITGAFVTGLAWSPDGAQIAVACDDGSLRLWTFERPDRVQLLSGEPEPGGAPGKLSFSADGRYLAAISAGRGLLWSGDGARFAGKIEIAGAEIDSLALTPDGRYALVSSAASGPEVWTLDPIVPCAAIAEKRRPCRVRAFGSQLEGAAFSPDGWQLHAGEGVPGESAQIGPEIHTWSVGRWDTPAANLDFSDGKPQTGVTYERARWVDGNLWLLVGVGDSVLRTPSGDPSYRLPGQEPVAISPDGRAIALTNGTAISVMHGEGWSQRLDVWGREASFLEEGLAVDPTGALLVTSSRVDNASRLFRLDRSAPSGRSSATSGVVFHHPFEAGLTFPGDLILQPERGYAVIAWDEHLSLWDLAASSPPRALAGENPRASRDGRYLVTFDGGKALLHDTHAAATPRPPPTEVNAEDCDATDAAFSPDGGKLILVCKSGTLREADLFSAGPARILASVGACASSNRAPQISDSGASALFFCGGADVRAVRREGQVDLPPLCESDAEWSLTPDGLTAVCGTDDGIAVFPLAAPEQVTLWSGWGAKVTWTSAVPEGRLAVAMTSDRTVRVVDLDAPGKVILTAEHAQQLTTVGTDRTGNKLVTGSLDGVIRIWSTRSGAPPVMVRQEKTMVGAMPMAVLSSDGDELLAASWVGTARVYNLSIPLLRAELAENTDCMPAELRRAHLGESAAAANDGYRDCESQRGR